MKAVLFDLDNTLLVRRPTIAEKWHADLCSNGFSVSAADTRRAFARCEMWVGEQVRRENESGIRLSDEDFLQGVVNCALDVLNIDAAASDLIARTWIGKYEKHYCLMDGAADILEHFSRSGFILGVVSNNRPEIRATLSDLGIAGYFRVIVISEEVDLYKPDPRILLHACEKLAVSPEEAVYVGDHPYDVVCASEAGMQSAWLPANEYMVLPPSAAEPTFHLKSLTDLRTVINRI